MFLGQYAHSLSEKGRLTLPAEFRPAFAGGCVLTKLIDGCVAIWEPGEFQRVADEMLEKARRGPVERNAARTFSGGAKPVSPDSHGRIVIPEVLRSYAGLSTEVVVVGAFNRVELWDAGTWADVEAAGEESLRSGGDGSLSDLGI